MVAEKTKRQIVEEIVKRGDVKIIKGVDEAYNFMAEKARRSDGLLRVRPDGDRYVVDRFEGPGVCKASRLTPEKIRAATVAVGLEWRDEYAERTVPYWSSDERVDRCGDIMLQRWRLKDYSLAPIILFGHDWGGIPIGNAIETRVDERSDDEYTGPALFQRVLFATRDINEQADLVYRMVKAGFLRQASVGVFPGEIIHPERESDRKALGLGKGGVLYDDNLLVETSVVTVPALPSAGVVSALKSMAKSLLPGDRDRVREVIARSSSEVDRNALDLQVRSVWKELFPESPSKKSEQPEPEQSAAKRYMYRNELGNKFFSIGDVVKVLKGSEKDNIGRVGGTSTNNDYQTCSVRMYRQDAEGYFQASEDVIVVDSNDLATASVPSMQYSGELRDLRLAQKDLAMQIERDNLRFSKTLGSVLSDLCEAVDSVFKADEDDEDDLDETEVEDSEVVEDLDLDEIEEDESGEDDDLDDVDEDDIVIDDDGDGA